MNYYPRYPGHYLSKTLHLTMEQDGAYTRLLDWYYANERPIPHAQRYAIARTQTASEKRSADVVLGEFFVRAGDDWRHDRAEQEMAVAQPRISAAKNNGKLGGRPKKNQKGNSEKPTGFPEETQDEPGVKAHQPPTSNSAVGEVTPPLPPDIAGEESSGVSPVVGLVVQLRQRGFGLTPSHPDLLAAHAAGVRHAAILRFADKYRTKPIGYAIAAAVREHTENVERVGKQEALEDRNRAVAADWAAQETEHATV